MPVWHSLQTMRSMVSHSVVLVQEHWLTTYRASCKTTIHSEWFGGTVNCKHIIAFRGIDDGFSIQTTAIAVNSSLVSVCAIHSLQISLAQKHLRAITMQTVLLTCLRQEPSSQTLPALPVVIQPTTSTLKMLRISAGTVTCIFTILS